MATLAIYGCVRAVEHESGAEVVKRFLCFCRVRKNSAEKQDNDKQQLENKRSAHRRSVSSK
jgi:hypothetical protein